MSRIPVHIHARCGYNHATSRELDFQSISIDHLRRGLGAGHHSVEERNAQMSRQTVNMCVKLCISKAVEQLTIHKPSRIAVQYRGECSGRQLEAVIRVVSVPQHLGGVRWWYCCPNCNRHTATLYLRGESFACRECQRLAYDSQSLPEHRRLLYHAQRLYRELGGDGNMWLYQRPARPKGMRVKKYQAMVAEIERVNLASLDAYMERFDNPPPSWMRLAKMRAMYQAGKAA